MRTISARSLLSFALAAGAFASLAVWVSAAGAVDFAPAVNYGGSEFPFGLAVADLDSNGSPDLVTADDDDSRSRATVLLGRGDGTFGTAAGYPAGDRSYGAAAADLDGDGHADIAVAELGLNAVGVLHGRGDGTLTAPTQWSVGSYPSDVVAGDLNGDGLIDLVSVDNGSGTVTVLRALGHGQFAAGRAFPVGDSYPERAALGDIDGDGHLDVAVAVGANEVAVLYGNGDGSLSAPVLIRVQGMFGNQPGGIALGDLNGDGRTDIATAGGSLVAVITNAGGRQFAGPRTFAAYPDAGRNGDAKGVAVGDFNGDRQLDVAVANSGTTEAPGDLAVLHGDGHGGLGPAEGYAIPATYSSWATSDGAAPNGVRAADLNRDGRPDLAVIHNITNEDPGGVAVLLNTGTWTPPATTQTTGGAPPSPTAPAAAPGVAALGLQIGRPTIHEGLARVRVRRAGAARGHTTVAIRSRRARRWHRLATSSRTSFTVRFRLRPGRYLLQAHFTGTLAQQRLSVIARRAFRLRRR